MIESRARARAKKNKRISEIRQVNNSRVLLDLLDSITSDSERKLGSYRKSNDYALIIREYALLAEAYSVASDIAEDGSTFSELKGLSSSFMDTSRYWNNQIEASKREGIEKYRVEASTLLQNGDYNGSILKIEKALELSPSDLNLLNEEGNVFFALSNYHRARDHYNKALKQDPNNVFVLTNLGLTLRHLGDYEQALRYFDKAIEINPEFETSFLGKGETLFFLKRFNEAKDAYSAATQINDKSAYAWHGLGVSISEGSYSYERAKQCIEKALELEPHDLSYKASLAEILLLLNEYEESESHAKEVLENPPTETLGFGMRLILVISAYLRNSEYKGMAAALDLITYYKSSSIQYESSFSTKALKNFINESNLDSDLKVTMLALTSLQDIPSDANRTLVADEIMRQIQVATVSARTRNLFRRLHDVPMNIRSIFGKRRINTESIIIVNTSYPNPSQSGYYNWDINLDAPENILSQIDYVKYTLHPTFPDRERIIKNKENGFRLSATGWGEFNIKIDVYFHKGQIITKYHWLTLTGET